MKDEIQEASPGFRTFKDLKTGSKNVDFSSNLVATPILCSLTLGAALGGQTLEN